MDKQIKVEEKLTKEERDILERNLEIFFAAIVKSPDTKGFDIEDIENKERFLKRFSPWHQEKGQELIQKFVDIVNNDQSTEDFSWLDILDADERWKEFEDDKLKKEIKENKNKFTNMRYQIPEHCHGDIDKAIIFHCMENPRGYVSDSLWGKKKESALFLKDYYKKTADNREENNRNESVEEIIKERYKLEHRYKLEKIDFKFEKFVKKVIFSEESALESDFNHMFNIFNKEDFEKKYSFQKSSKDLIEFYFLKNFYYQLIQDNRVPNIKELEGKREQVETFSKQFCNLEIYPFSASNPSLKSGEIGDKFINYSDLSRLGIYIILRRVYIYLINKKENEKEQNPVFILRKYETAWENLFKRIFEEVKEKNQSFDNELVLSLLEKGFFYCQTGRQGGGITDGNVISVPNLKRISDELKETKKKDFDSIKSLLTKVEN
ncbi:hypothetical protein [Streptococcus sp. HMSC074F05]|uniref:hypothetical protein n=1 Tax=Streptococcus sp. HMSC074F05 TaxID=1715164 RepID=UPI0008A2747C|nr:hypothetical protein [Streptococcus sp. HMSC074F05]OFN92912.1 hypothetical protein HMPREF2685_06475 [Streptococcus sp. HMSC074F05]